jgi:predicted DNA-binding transcriptional regulator YafY
MRLLEGAKRGLTVQDLHAKVGGASLRTIFRDVKCLEKAGFPVYEEDGRWRALVSGEPGAYAVPINPTELLAVLVSEELLAPLESTDLGEALKSLRDKLSSMLAPSGRAFAADIKARVLATFSAPGAYGGTRGDTVKIVEDAIAREHRLEIEYWSPTSGEGTRKIDPYFLWFADGRLYLVAWCHLREAYRTFSLDRLRHAELLDEAFEPDRDFDARKFTGGGFGVWNGAPERVVVEFRPEAAHLPSERRYHPTQKLERQPDGAMRVSMEVAGLAQIAAWVASFGGSVVAREPAELVALVFEIYCNGLRAHTEVAPRTRR